MAQRRGHKRPQEIFAGLWIDEVSDNQAPLVARELLDALLERLLVRFLVDDKKQIEAFFSGVNFASRVRLCYLLGLISPEEAADLHLVEEIRDEFVRTLGERSFNEERIQALVDRLVTARQFREHPASLGHARDPRMRFNAAVHILARYLAFRIHDKTSAEKRTVHPPFRYTPPGEIPPVRNRSGSSGA